MNKRGPSERHYTTGGNVNWYSQNGEQYGGFLQKPKNLQYEPVIPLLGISAEKTMI